MANPANPNVSINIEYQNTCTIISKYIQISMQSIHSNTSLIKDSNIETDMETIFNALTDLVN